MNTEQQSIITGYGLGNIKFGSTRDEIKSILGEPDEIEAYSYTDSDEDLTESWHYDNLDLSMSFDEEDNWRLVTISITSDFYEFMKLNPVGMKKSHFLSELEKLDIFDLEYENCSTPELPNHEVYKSLEHEMNFWLEDNIVTEVQWGPLFIDDDTINWPE